jgi:hypothetical protein
MTKTKVTLRPNTNVLRDKRNAWVVVKIEGDLDVPGKGDGEHGNVARPGECISEQEAQELVSRTTRYTVRAIETKD